MNAKDLPPELRKILLARIREQLGDQTFRSLQMSMSDDQIVEAAMQQSAETSIQQHEPAAKSTWSGRFGSVLGVIGMVLACCGPGFVVVQLLTWLVDKISDLSSIHPERAKAEKPSDSTGCMVVIFLIGFLINVIWLLSLTPSGK